MKKQCTICKKERALSCFSKAGRGNTLRSDCKQCNAKRYKKWKEKNRASYLESTTNSGLKIRYGIDLTQYEKLLEEQKGKCKICGTTKPGRKGIKRFSIDHCHKTNKIRGLLCMPCNTAIGLLKEDPNLFDAAKQYLKCNTYDPDLI